MKKGFKIGLVILIALIVCTGCNGDVTRALRHDGFSVGGTEFICDAFMEDESTERIKFMTSSNIFTESGRIYDLSLSQKFSNNSHCKVADTNLKFVALFDDKVFKADDGKFYYLVSDKGSYTEIDKSDNAYSIYELLLGPEGTLKVITADSNNGLYYVLKSDGNVYAYTIEKASRNSVAKIIGTTVVYDREYYGGDIIDFNYAGESGATFVRSASKTYRMKATNFEECSKFADIKCDYAMSESEAITENNEFVLAFNGSTLITTYGKIFTAS